MSKQGGSQEFFGGGPIFSLGGLAPLSPPFISKPDVKIKLFDLSWEL